MITSALIGASKCNFPALLRNYDRPTSQPTDQPTNRQEVLLQMRSRNSPTSLIKLKSFPNYSSPANLLPRNVRLLHEKTGRLRETNELLIWIKLFERSPERNFVLSSGIFQIPCNIWKVCREVHYRLYALVFFPKILANKHTLHFAVFEKKNEKNNNFHGIAKG